LQTLDYYCLAVANSDFLSDANIFKGGKWRILNSFFLEQFYSNNYRFDEWNFYSDFAHIIKESVFRDIFIFFPSVLIIHFVSPHNISSKYRLLSRLCFGLFPIGQITNASRRQRVRTNRDRNFIFVYSFIKPSPR